MLRAAGRACSRGAGIAAAAQRAAGVVPSTVTFQADRTMSFTVVGSRDGTPSKPTAAAASVPAANSAAPGAAPSAAATPDADVAVTGQDYYSTLSIAASNNDSVFANSPISSTAAALALPISGRVIYESPQRESLARAGLILPVSAALITTCATILMATGVAPVPDFGGALAEIFSARSSGYRGSGASGGGLSAALDAIAQTHAAEAAAEAAKTTSTPGSAPAASAVAVAVANAAADAAPAAAAAAVSIADEPNWVIRQLLSLSEQLQQFNSQMVPPKPVPGPDGVTPDEPWWATKMREIRDDSFVAQMVNKHAPLLSPNPEIASTALAQAQASSRAAEAAHAAGVAAAAAQAQSSPAAVRAVTPLLLGLSVVGWLGTAAAVPYFLSRRVIGTIARLPGRRLRVTPVGIAGFPAKPFTVDAACLIPPLAASGTGTRPLQPFVFLDNAGMVGGGKLRKMWGVRTIMLGGRGNSADDQNLRYVPQTSAAQLQKRREQQQQQQRGRGGAGAASVAAAAAAAAARAGANDAIPPTAGAAAAAEARRILSPGAGSGAGSPAGTNSGESLFSQMRTMFGSRPTSASAAAGGERHGSESQGALLYGDTRAGASASDEVWVWNGVGVPCVHVGYARAQALGQAEAAAHRSAPAATAAEQVVPSADEGAR